MKKLAVITMAVICSLFFVACSGSVTTANITDVQLALAVDEDTWEPINVTNEFYTDTAVIYVTGIVDNAPEDTLVGAEWLYIEDGEEIFIDGADLETEDTKTPVVFSLDKPNDDWPLGEYKVNIYIDKKVVTTLTFHVVESEEEVIVETIYAEIFNLQLASEVDESTCEPISVTDAFNVDSPIIYVTCDVENVTPIQIIRAEWYYLEEGNDVFLDEASSELTDVYNCTYFSYVKPSEGWPLGEYAVDLYIDDNFMDSIYFTVE